MHGIQCDARLMSHEASYAEGGATQYQRDRQHVGAFDYRHFVLMGVWHGDIRMTARCGEQIDRYQVAAPRDLTAPPTIRNPEKLHTAGNRYQVHRSAV